MYLKRFWVICEGLPRRDLSQMSAEGGPLPVLEGTQLFRTGKARKGQFFLWLSHIFPPPSYVSMSGSQAFRLSWTPLTLRPSDLNWITPSTPVGL